MQCSSTELHPSPTTAFKQETKEMFLLQNQGLELWVERVSTKMKGPLIWGQYVGEETLKC
jgi:hypothetical protein